MTKRNSKAQKNNHKALSHVSTKTVSHIILLISMSLTTDFIYIPFDAIQNINQHQQRNATPNIVKGKEGNLQNAAIFIKRQFCIIQGKMFQSMFIWVQ